MTDAQKPRPHKTAENVKILAGEIGRLHHELAQTKAESSVLLRGYMTLGDAYLKEGERRRKQGQPADAEKAHKTEAPKKLLLSLAWASAAGDEYSAVGVQTFLDSGGNLTAIARVARDERGDPVIGRLLDHVKSALLGGA